MSAPAERADHMAETAHGLEGRVQRRAADRIEHDVEPAALRVPCHIVLDALRLVVDRRGAELRDERVMFGRAGCKHVRAECAGDLDRDMADAARAAMDQDFLPGADMRA